MCGRYLLDADFDELYRKYIIFEREEFKRHNGDVYPTNIMPVVVRSGQHNVLKNMTWGLRGFQKGQRLINARCETILEKPRFRKLVDNRCIIPATAFFEWETQGKQKIRHILKTDSLISFAGIYEPEPIGPSSYAIITMASHGEIEQIHDRMPIALSDDALDTWLNPNISTVAAYEILMKQSPKYFLRDETTQLKFF